MQKLATFIRNLKTVSSFVRLVEDLPKILHRQTRGLTDGQRVMLYNLMVVKSV